MNTKLTAKQARKISNKFLPFWFGPKEWTLDKVLELIRAKSIDGISWIDLYSYDSSKKKYRLKLSSKVQKDLIDLGYDVKIQNNRVYIGWQEALKNK